MASKLPKMVLKHHQYMNMNLQGDFGPWQFLPALSMVGDLKEVRINSPPPPLWCISFCLLTYKPPLYMGVGVGGFTLPIFKLSTIHWGKTFLVQNHLVNSYSCIDCVWDHFLVVLIRFSESRSTFQKPAKKFLVKKIHFLVHWARIHTKTSCKIQN